MGQGKTRKKGLGIVGQEAAPSETSSSGKIAPFVGRAAIVTLGCAKNHVDSEVMLGVLASRGFEVVSKADEADVVVVNTCGFLESAVKEGIDCVLDLAELKSTGRLRKLLVAGCMVERYGESLRDELPEVDGFLTTSDLLKVGDLATEGTADLLAGAGRPYFLYDDTMPRRLATPGYTAYVKISEGCDRPCTFCIIPRIRGAMRSREIASVVREVESLGRAGVREVNLVAQDLTAFGADRGAAGEIIPLLESLDASGAVDWIRLLYAYPLGISDELLDRISSLPRVCNYLDIPLQHVSDPVLAAMRRPRGRFAPRPLVERMRSRAPNMHIRTTFIVGFPGETEEDVKQLEEFVRAGHFTNVGVFSYSQEEGSPAGAMENQIPEEAKAERRARILEAQQAVVQERWEALRGATLSVIVEGPHEETELLLVGRAEFQAPEVDGTVLINDIAPGIAPPLPGDIVRVEIAEAAGYDLVGCITAPDQRRGHAGAPNPLAGQPVSESAWPSPHVSESSLSRTTR